MSFLKGFFKANPVGSTYMIEMQRQELLRKEIVATRRIFGSVKEGSVRDFFCVDRNSWIWYEEWKDHAGQSMRMTTRFEVRNGQVFKSRNGRDFAPLGEQELNNFKASVYAYLSIVKKTVYSELR